MANKVDLGVGVSGGGTPPDRSPPPLTIEKLVKWIKAQGLDDYTTKGLIDMAYRYPYQALPNFRKNFTLMVNRVRAKRRKEFGVTPIRKGLKDDEQITKEVPEEDFQEDWEKGGQGRIIATEEAHQAPTESDIPSSNSDVYSGEPEVQSDTQ